MPPPLADCFPTDNCFDVLRFQGHGTSSEQVDDALGFVLVQLLGRSLQVGNVL
jgi:hypothetical protein